MKIVETDVRPGKCFITATHDKVRRVRAVASGVVSFEARGRTPIRGAWPIRSDAPMADFLGEVAREVGCDFVVRTEPQIHL